MNSTVGWHRHVGTGLTAFVLCGVMAGAALAQPVVVSQNNVGVDWFLNDTRLGGMVTFEDGPATPPLGFSSLHMRTTDDFDGPPAPNSKSKAQFFNYGFIGTKLADITALSYAAYRFSSSTNSAAQTISINLEVDFVGDGSSFTTLVFEPIYQPGGIGAMMTDAWQIWDAYDGGDAIWWSTRLIPGVCANACYVPWSTIVGSNPNAKIRFGVGFNVGSGWTGEFHGAADALSIGVGSTTTTFNFERALSANESKTRAISDLSAMLPTGDANADLRIQKAIEALTHSLGVGPIPNDLWEDEHHLTMKGRQVFEREKQAVRELVKVLPPTDVSGAISLIVAADAALAGRAVDEATAGATLAGCAPASTSNPCKQVLSYITKADAEIAKAAEDLANGEFEKAIEHYKRAWDFAQKAANKTPEP